MRGVHPVAVRFERRPRRVERLRRPAQVARDERDLGLGDDAPRAGHGLFRTEGARRTSQESLRANEIAELRHRDAAQRERRRVVAQGDPLQCAERITRRERARRGRDQRVHRNPATLVTPTVRCPALIYLMTVNQHVVSRTDATTNAKERRTMTTHMTGTREEWLAARLELLEAEKELTRRSDELARRRQELPWVRIDKDVSIRDRRRERLAGGPLPRALAAARLPLHVRARLQGGLSVLLGDRGRVQRLRRPPGEPRRHACGGVAGAAREAAGVQAADGLDVSLGVLVRQRLQLRLQRLVHRGAAARGRHRIQLPARAGVHARGRRRQDGAARGRSPSSRPCAEPTWPRTRASGRA